MNIARSSEIDYLTINKVEGKPITGSANVKPLLKGENMTILEMNYHLGAISPMHLHNHETLLYVIEGKVQVTVGTEKFVLNAGDACHQPEGEEHNVEALTESTFLEIKSPAPSLEQFLGIS
ncbi:MAG: Cupin domain protein [Chloroflexi bacterium]|jgi:quercetin dioxygenase-like cupin family protein|nr:MAG: Cupin domain protein [Chloroflexota bacterium]